MNETLKKIEELCTNLFDKFKIRDELLQMEIKTVLIEAATAGSEACRKIFQDIKFK